VTGQPSRQVAQHRRAEPGTPPGRNRSKSQPRAHRHGQSNAKHYKSNTITEVKEFRGKAHLLPAQDGWQEIADYALEWAVSHAHGVAAS